MERNPTAPRKMVEDALQKWESGLISEEETIAILSTFYQQSLNVNSVSARKFADGRMRRAVDDRLDRRQLMRNLAP